MRIIDHEELDGMLHNGGDVLLLDVLPEESYKRKHIPGAKNDPVDSEDFTKRAEKLAGSKDRKVVTYCGGFKCSASTTAAEKLEEDGFKNVYDYKGGLEEWFSEQEKDEDKNKGKKGSCCKTC